MAEDNRRQVLLESIERIRSSAKKLEGEAISLHQIVRFDHQSSGAGESALKIESELEQLTSEMQEFRALLREPRGVG